jgi:hypothetical protein
MVEMPWRPGRPFWIRVALPPLLRRKESDDCKSTSDWIVGCVGRVDDPAMQIKTTVDVPTYEAQVDTLMTEQVVPGLVDAVNAVAALTDRRIVEAMGAYFDRTSPFTLSGVSAFTAKATGPHALEALVFIKDQTAAYHRLRVSCSPQTDDGPPQRLRSCQLRASCPDCRSS